MFITSPRCVRDRTWTETMLAFYLLNTPYAFMSLTQFERGMVQRKTETSSFYCSLALKINWYVFCILRWLSVS